MQPLRMIGKTDTYLTPEQYQYLENEITKISQISLKARKIFKAVKNIDPGAQSYAFDTAGEMSPANIDWAWPGRLNIDAPTKERKSITIPYIHKEGKIGKYDLLSSQRNGAPLDTTTFEACALKVTRLIDEMLLLGWSENGTNYHIKGLYTAAGNDIATSLPFSNAANIETALTLSTAALLNNGFEGPYNLILNPAQYTMMGKRIDPATGDTWRKWAQENVLLGGEVIASGTIPAGKGLVSPVEHAEAFKLILAEDTTLETAITDLEDGSNLFGRVYFRGLPVVYQPLGLCRLSNIG